MLNLIRTRWQRCGEAGWSLIQLLMALTISGIGVGAAFAMLTIGQRHMQRGDLVTNLQQEIRTSIEWITREVREAPVDSVWIDQTGTAISFASARDESGVFIQDAEGYPQWQRTVVYYLQPGTMNLYRYTTLKTDWSQLFDPNLAVNESLGELVGDDVASILVSLQGSLLTIALETIGETQSGATTTNHLTSDVVLRNQL